VLSFSILLTDIDLISSDDKKVKSTPLTAEDIGCEIFIRFLISLAVCPFGLCQTFTMASVVKPVSL
jgi:hypothetical protein